ncbi:hypothetical protein ACFY2M_39350 [Streptomyces sp. NPDC001276]|uniref:hypothetical protein n=1 Tax=Streptomyces sp. NPDC001276 TaxID=3364555 RepID=UPI0036B0FCE4
MTTGKGAETAATFRVTLQFRKDGPSSSGWWPRLEVAEQKFAAWIGTYGSLDQVVIQLVDEKGDGRETVLKTWTREQGEAPGPT